MMESDDNDLDFNENLINPFEDLDANYHSHEISFLVREYEYCAHRLASVIRQMLIQTRTFRSQTSPEFSVERSRLISDEKGLEILNAMARNINHFQMLIDKEPMDLPERKVLESVSYYCLRSAQERLEHLSLEDKIRQLYEQQPNELANLSRQLD